MFRPYVLHALHIPDRHTLGGAELQALRLMERIPRDLYRLGVLIVSDFEDSSFRRLLGEKSIPSFVVKEARHLIDPNIIRRTISILRGQSPDLLHIHNTYFSASPYLSIFARWAGIRRVVVTEQTNYPQQPSFLGKVRKYSIYYTIDQTVAVSKAVRDTLQNKYKYSLHHVRVIPNAVDVDAIAQRVASVDKIRLRQELGLRPEEKIIGSVANLRPEKGVRFLVESMPILLRSVENVRLLLIGDGEERQLIEALISDLSLEESVLLLGWRGDVVPLLGLFDVFVLPSLSEGLPLSVLEAMAAGLPIVATAVGGTPEIVTHHETGLLIPPSNAAALSQAITLMLDDKSLADDLRKKAQEVALNNYGIPKLVQAYMNLYAELDVGEMIGF